MYSSSDFPLVECRAVGRRPALPGEFRYSATPTPPWLTKAALLRMMEDPAGVYAGR